MVSPWLHYDYNKQWFARHSMPPPIGGAIGGARGAMAPPIIWLGGAILYLAPPNILHWNLKF